MNPARLSRTFQRIVAALLPASAAMTAACSGESTPTVSLCDGKNCAVGASGASDGAADEASSSGTITLGGSGTTVSPCAPFPVECCGSVPQVSISDGGLLFDDAGIPTNCLEICGPPGDCYLASPGVVGCRSVQMADLCTGRRPAGLLDPELARGTSIGDYFASAARLEEASVDAFHHLRRELVAHGAPRRFVRAAERAARDEMRHARAMGGLARRYGCVPLAAEVEPRSIRGLEAIAIENAVEGCVREAFGALLATFQAHTAGDPAIRAVMMRVARDETRHAALALQVNGWLKGRLVPTARARVERARRGAMTDLATSVAETPPALQTPLGLPTALQARFLQQQLGAMVA
jgi:hypothetical protein